MDGLYTNTSRRSDFHARFFQSGAARTGRLRIASAFFTDEEGLLTLAASGARTELIVRLGFPTLPRALRRVLQEDRIQCRFLTDPAFHAKLYIVRGFAALVTSANLTRAGFTTNQEVGISINADDPRFDELDGLFEDYWDAAHVLTPGVVDDYERVYRLHSSAAEGADRAIADLVKQKIGHYRIDNVQRDKLPTDGRRRRIDAYRADYQSFLSAFRITRALFEQLGLRRYPETFPLRLEIDAMLSDLYEDNVRGNEAAACKVRDEPELSKHVRDAVRQWQKLGVARSHERSDHHERIFRVFGSADAISNASLADLVDGLRQMHSVSSRSRYAGGHDAQRQELMEVLPLEPLKDSLTHLLYGRGDVVERMYDCTRGDWRLQELGRSAIQELVGWVNTEELPIANDRARKALRWLGFDVGL